jgi:transglutaminase-like putative cysteine protease
MMQPEIERTPHLELRVGCRFEFEVAGPTPLALMLEPAAEVIRTARWSLPQGVDLPPAEHDGHGNPIRRLILPEGTVSFGYDAIVSAPADRDPDPGDAPQQLVEQLPTAVLPYLLPSRYCESDRLAEFAWKQFGSGPVGAARVQAVSDWVHEHLTFRYGAADPFASARDVMAAGEGVCRDFAHLAIGLCRALTIPTRYAFGYLPDIDVPPSPDPMDFCAWMEVYLGGTWWAYDPRNNARRIGRTTIGRGRDAADVPMITTWGPADLKAMTVVAEPAG